MYINHLPISYKPNEELNNIQKHYISSFDVGSFGLVYNDPKEFILVGNKLINTRNSSFLFTDQIGNNIVEYLFVGEGDDEAENQQVLFPVSLNVYNVRSHTNKGILFNRGVSNVITGFPDRVTHLTEDYLIRTLDILYEYESEYPEIRDVVLDIYETTKEKLRSIGTIITKRNRLIKPSILVDSLIETCHHCNHLDFDSYGCLEDVISTYIPNIPHEIETSKLYTAITKNKQGYFDVKDINKLLSKNVIYRNKNCFDSKDIEHRINISDVVLAGIIPAFGIYDELLTCQYCDFHITYVPEGNTLFVKSIHTVNQYDLSTRKNGWEISVIKKIMGFGEYVLGSDWNRVKQIEFIFHNKEAILTFYTNDFVISQLFQLSKYILVTDSLLTVDADTIENVENEINSDVSNDLFEIDEDDEDTK